MTGAVIDASGVPTPDHGGGDERLLRPLFRRIVGSPRPSCASPAGSRPKWRDEARRPTIGPNGSIRSARAAGRGQPRTARRPGHINADIKRRSSSVEMMGAIAAEAQRPHGHAQHDSAMPVAAWRMWTRQCADLDQRAALISARAPVSAPEFRSLGLWGTARLCRAGQEQARPT